jgi:hypothetical protein
VENWRARVGIAVLGVAAIIAALVIRNDPTVACFLIVIGCALILAGYFGPFLKTLKVKGGTNSLEIETRDLEERDAAAAIADSSSSIETFEEAIASDELLPPGPSDQDSTVIGGLNLAAGEIALKAIFERATTGILAGCTLRLYLYDEDDDALAPALDPDHSDTRWAVGAGATGHAYATGQYVLATGTATCDDTYGLSSEQQKRYAKLAAVASMPVYNAAGTVIAVVTAATTDNASDLPTPLGELTMVTTALLTSRVLVELLQWFDDGRQG